MSETIGILHPGEMGISVAASARNSGHSVLWAADGRSAETRQRAETQGLVDAGTLKALCQECTVIISVCPPHAAEETAQAALEQGFRGLYVDANAIAPARAVRIGEALAAGGTTFVDGGIIGGPAWKPGETWLYLAGEQAGRAAACFTAGPLETEVLGAEIGRASALKMCYAAVTKGTTALLCAALGAAEGLGIRGDLERHWERDEAGSVARTQRRVQRVTAKAWRFAGEMDEIAATFTSAGMPAGFHQAAAEIYQRLAGFKAQAETPALEEVLEALGNIYPLPAVSHHFDSRLSE